MTRKSSLRGFDTTRAEYDAAKSFASQWPIRHNVHELDFTQNLTHWVCGELLDELELEANFHFFDSHAIPCV